MRGALNGVEAFLRVAERRSFSAAAVDLGVTPSAVSQTIRALEDRIGVPLLMRTTRSVGLTQAGQLFLERSKPAVADLNEAIEAARYLGDRPAGLLRINILRAAIEPLFAPILAGFCEAYPEIELEIFAEDGLSDLSAGGFDCGVRLGEALDADMVAVRLYDPFRFVTAATPGYLQRYGRPKTIAELSKHRCVRLRLATGAFMPWQFMQGNRPVEINVNGPIIVNDFGAQRIAMMSGVAIGYAAEPSVIEEVKAGNLELLFDDMAVTSGGAFLYYPSKRQVMPKLRAFIDYVRATLPLQRPS